MEQSKIDLAWLRILRMSVRLGSFTSAAQALGLSQPAVSYQMRKLEQQAGFAVLRRGRHGVELTTQGRRLFEIADRAVEDIDAVIREHRATATRPSVRLRTDYAFSSLWLIPRMHRFRQHHPEIDIQIVATQRFVPHEMEPGDVAVVFGDQQSFGSDAALLVKEDVVPLCSQGYLAQHGPFDDESRLAGARLIHLDAQTPSPWFDWNSYFNELGISRSQQAGQGDMAFNTYGLVIQAAIENEGLALGWKGLVDQLVRSKVLIQVGAHLARRETGYWVVTQQPSTIRSQRLSDWLKSEITDPA